MEHRNVFILIASFVAMNVFLVLQVQYFRSAEGQGFVELLTEWTEFYTHPERQPREPRPSLHLGTSFRASNRSWIVMTTQRDSPSDFVRSLSAKVSDWRIVAVGGNDLDDAQLKEWHGLRLVTYLGPSEQRAMNLRIAKRVPTGSKNFGLLYAVRHGARRILETEDGDESFDHELLDDPSAVFLSPHPSEIEVYDDDRDESPFLLDPFRRFTTEGVRGLRSRGSSVNNDEKSGASDRDLPTRTRKGCRKLLIQHSVQNGVSDRDTDGMDDRRHAELWASLSKGQSERQAYSTLPFRDAKPLSVPKGVFAPFNGRSTLYHADALWASVSLARSQPRQVDVLKAFWAERLVWELHSDVGFLRPMLTRVPHKQGPENRDSSESLRTREREEGGGALEKTVLHLKNAEINPFLDLPSAATILAENMILETDSWEGEDVRLLVSWFEDLRDEGYVFPTFSSVCNASVAADPDADASLYVVARPIELLKSAFVATTKTYFCCGRSSFLPWSRWFSNNSLPSVTNSLSVLEAEGDSLRGATIVLDFSRISLWDLEKIMDGLSEDAGVLVLYHTIRTFCPPGCEDEEGIETMTKVSEIVEDFLVLKRSWKIEWEPLVPGEMKYPSPWILVRSSAPPVELATLDNITRRQFPEDCDQDPRRLWYLSYYLKVGMNGGFAYGIHTVAGDLYNAMMYENVIMDWSPRPWPSYFGNRDGMELDGREVCRGSNVGCALLPVTHCHPSEPSRTIDQWDPKNRGPIVTTPVANLTRKLETIADGRFVLGWMYRLKKFFRDEIRTVLEDLPVPARWYSVHIRRGNKIHEAQHTPIENYIETIDKIPGISGSREIYVCTDSEVALKELSTFADRYRFHVDWTQRRFLEDIPKPIWDVESAYWLVPGQTTERTPHANHRAVVGTLADLWFMIHSEHHVGTSTSNVFTFVRAVRSNEKRNAPMTLVRQGSFQHNL